MRSTSFLLPFMIFLFTVKLPAALSLYWLTGGIVAIIQQGIALREDETDMEAIADAPSRTKDVAAIPEAEIVKTPSKNKNKTRSGKKKRRK